MSDTPISDSTPHNVADLGMRIRMIERELTAANTIIRQQQLLDEETLRLQERIKRLEAAGDAMERWCSDYQTAFNWEKAKEAKL
jgi:Na+/phosphate symporter